LNLWYREYYPDEGFKAIFIAEGTPAPRVLTFGREKVQGQEFSGVMYGNTFLYEVSHGNIKPGYFKGQKVIVIGGGNVAFDVARTARRLGGETTIVSLECGIRNRKTVSPQMRRKSEGHGKRESGSSIPEG
jgi:glutamate synthase (NADPH/NADH) small chain